MRNSRIRTQLLDKNTTYSKSSAYTVSNAELPTYVGASLGRNASTRLHQRNALYLTSQSALKKTMKTQKHERPFSKPLQGRGPGPVQAHDRRRPGNPEDCLRVHGHPAGCVPGPHRPVPLHQPVPGQRPLGPRRCENAVPPHPVQAGSDVWPSRAGR